MSKFARILSLVLVLAFALSTAGAVMAQDQELPGAGEGGIIIRGNTRGSTNLGPLVSIRCSGVDCADVYGLMFPSLLGVSPQSQNLEVGVPGTIATDYEVSEDGLTYTFSLREDLTWSDGEAITAEDVYFVWEALQQGQTIGMSSSFSPYAAALVGAEIVDDYTIALQFEERNCVALQRSALPVLPAHAFGYTYEDRANFDWASMVGHPMDRNPSVTYGPFKFTRIEPGTGVYLEADQNYSADAIDGLVRPTGFVYLDTPDQNVMIERFIAFQPGDINYVSEPDASTFTTIEEAGAQFFSAPGRVWHYVALNLADPANPQNGLDEEGNPIDQGQHPIFGDVRVRQALQHAINIDEIINGPLNGNATAMVAGTIPTAYTIHPDLERRPFDLEAARALLDEAGWVATGDALVDGGDGLRTCQGCETAEEGTELDFDMMNVGDIRNDVAIILQDQFAEIGVRVNVVVLDFNTMYDDNMGAQIYDSAVAGWRGALPFDPDQRSFFGAENDIFGEGYGFNFPSYYNAELEELGAEINSGSCEQEDIIAAAHRIQEILYEEQPYLWLYAFNSGYAAAPNIANFAPVPNFGAWNIDQWAVVQ